MYAGVFILDGNRARFGVADWKTALALKVLRSRLRDMLTRSFRTPGRLPSAQQEKWFDVWQRIYSQDFGGSGEKRAIAAPPASSSSSSGGSGGGGGNAGAVVPDADGSKPT